MEHAVILGWSEFFVASAGAAGALAGLVFVTLSINLARIIELPGVTGRAAETILLLAGCLAGSLVALVPYLTKEQLGGWLLAVAAPMWFAPMVIQAQAVRRRTYHRPQLLLLRAVSHQVATLPCVLAGLALVGLLPGGIAWFAFAVVASMLVALFNSWVLLVEIMR